MWLKSVVGYLVWNLIILWNVCDCVQTHQDANPPRGAETVINLLKAQNVTHSQRLVSKAKGRDPEMPAWRFRSRMPHLTLPQDLSDYLFSTSQGVLGLHLVGRQTKGSEATLISFISPAHLQHDGRPLLELVSNTKENWLQLEFRSANGQPEVIKLPGGNPFIAGGWVRMALSVEPRQVVMFLECDEAVVLKLKEGGRILALDFPHDLQVTFSSTAGNKASKFNGIWQTAELSTRAYERRPWICDNLTDSLSDTAQTTSPTGSAVSDLDMMQDQGDRGDEVALSQRYPSDSYLRFGQMESNLHNMMSILDMLKKQNPDLQARIDHLQTCDHTKQKCVYEGRQLDEGYRWSSDSRTSCSCTNGQVQCNRLSECSFHGNIYKNGDVFSPDDCNRCTCKRERVECDVNPCPSQSCEEPSVPKRSCCRDCQTKCEHHGQIYENGDVFVSRSNPCLNCKCSNSQVSCNPIQCPNTPCPNPYRRRGECCPTCSVCDVVGRPYKGSFSTVDGCQTCTCQGGKQSCVNVQQCPQTCQDGVKPPFGSCCRDCSRCIFKGEVVLNGLSFQPPRDPCRRCVCNEGNIACETQSCPTSPCRLVETVGGQCCPRCRSCVQDNVWHLHGSQWKRPDDPCTTCTCTEGKVQCVSVRCDVPCKNPASPPPGSCCPVCDGCIVNGRDIPNGMSLPPGPPCEGRCICENGNINCVRYPCPPTPCQNPVRRPGECCKRCEECRYEGDVYSDGQTFVSRQNPCLKCQCSGKCHDHHLFLSVPGLHFPQSALPSVTVPACDLLMILCCLLLTCALYTDLISMDPAIRLIHLRQEKCDTSLNHVMAAAPMDTHKMVATITTTPVHVSTDLHEQSQVTVDLHEPSQVTDDLHEPSQVTVDLHEPSQVTVDLHEPSQVTVGLHEPSQATVDLPEPTPTSQAAGIPKPPPATPHTSPPAASHSSSSDAPHARSPVAMHSSSSVATHSSSPVATHSDSLDAMDKMAASPRPMGKMAIPEGCIWNGVQYEEGAAWTDAGQSCSCGGGQVTCSPKPPCNNPCAPTPVPCPTPGGECCGSCGQCQYKQRFYENGQTFKDLEDPCVTCHCQDGQALCAAASCIGVTCSNPYTPPGECCPRCPDCEYENQIITNGDTFPNRENQCEDCVCTDGRVECGNRECPKPKCNNPRPGTCCQNNCNGPGRLAVINETMNSAVCQKILKDNIRPSVHDPKLKRTWVLQQDNDPKHTSKSTSEWPKFLHSANGNVQCLMKRCPAVNCADSFIQPGECCAQCPAPLADCYVEGQRYRHMQQFYHPINRCQLCTCTNGMMRCQHRPCPSATCSHPIIQECCRTCDGCLYNRKEHANGATFEDTSDPCRTCVCRDGTVTCNRKQCPCTACPFPVQGKCCPHCDGCMYGGMEYQNGQEFADPADHCGRCMCRNGHVTCSKRQCPNPGCSHPVIRPGQCCPVCDGCLYNRKEHANGDTFEDTSDQCRTCVCRDGTVTCNRKQCPRTACPFPVQGKCCPHCDGCMYGDVEYQNGQEFADPADHCGRCMCRNGHVTCSKRQCPNPGCSHPVIRPGQCCPVCDGCLYNRKEHANGDTFEDTSDQCRTCVCRDGTVTCNRKQCPRTACPFPVQGKCCPHCDGCIYGGVEYQNGQEFADPADHCGRCMCRNGHVTCNKRQCPNPGCSYPVIRPGQCCPVCDGCQFEGRVYADGETFQSPTGSCEECRCSRGEVQCCPKSCSKVSCPNPWRDPCTCNVCEGCLYRGRECGNGERFPNPSDPCQGCICLNGSVSCTPVSCPEAPCKRPVRPPGECCPVCTGTCEHLGQVHENGATFTPPNDRCSTCICQSGDVFCEKKLCSQQCTHPVRYRNCCPVCGDCLFEGQKYGNTQTFYVPSDPCKRCACHSGSVTCTVVACPVVSCQNPVTPPGQCCPQCRVCVQQGQEYEEGQSLTLHPTDHCLNCTCVGGEVSCVGPQCAKLTCMHQVTDLGSCCPRCRGCFYDGVEHLEGSTWFPSSGPCMSCMCVNGVTTCSEVHCLSTCLNQISVPGECCPVCADCVFEGHVYGPGESFHPSGDPCQICTCEVMPDGQQHLRCYRKQCPSLVDCPKHNILYSGSDSCCPVCAQPVSNCTATLIGNEVLATDDPCFTCQCKDLTWTCIHRGCPPLSCPPDDQHTPPDTCCPICDKCVLEGDQTHVPNGQRWTDKENECITCICNQGHIECNLQECPPLDCPDGSVKVKNPGKCCLECKGITAVVQSIDTGAQCVYEGQVYSHNDHWEVDECTSCTCVSRDVHCQTQRCPTLTCASDETPALVPGMCCPHCIPHPATCIVFGDPHYRTFDGKMVNFQGTCTYVLAQDCEGGDFSVHVSNEDRGRKGVSWTKEVTVFIGHVVVQLFQDWIVKVDYQPVSLPFLKEPYVYLERKTNTILLNTNVGLKVLWNGRSHVEVSVPGTYKKHMCGLCGNFNNYPLDDMKLRNGQIAKSEADFGNNWKVGSGNSSFHCSDVKNINPCKKAGYSARKTANTRCAVLKSPVFERCHKVVPPKMFFASCVYDLCACGSNIDECLCDVLEAYSSQCREAGIILQWRSPTLCAMGCPLDRGYVFDECGPPCPKTCFNKDVPLGVIEAHCFKPCVPGCQCPAGLVEHNSHCIIPEKCPKIIHGSLGDPQTVESNRKLMEECLHLVCETIGVHEDDEVGVDVICSLYKSVFLITASLEDTKRAILQVRGQSGGLLCSARGVLHVLLVMEKQRKNREEYLLNFPVPMQKLL
ncbi:kielin/chordin-like protein [Chanodichthys erythropterus]|uniref:kielin/chordin-like protein n=1 Tax=Chanodichthys erythropterus TaxID=933992 RepID=UPI00351F616F